MNSYELNMINAKYPAVN
uniref:Uncharacterized protein n=1 Tax=Arundo donax TaxID=35708 RepID=A0A0A8YBE3_ARUDO